MALIWKMLSCVLCSVQLAVCLQVVPYTLAENAGLHPISIVTELRSRHANGEVSLFLFCFVFPPFILVAMGVYVFISSYFIMKVLKKYRPELAEQNIDMY